MTDPQDGPRRADNDPALDAQHGFAAPSEGPTAGSGTAPEGFGFAAPSEGPGAGSGTAPEGLGFSVPSEGPGVGSGTAPPVVEDEPEPGPSRMGCRTELRGWAGGHLHGAVRPRRRAASRGRPPGRWC